MRVKDMLDGPTLDRLKDRIEENEGRRYRAYEDANGVWTIGVGHARGVRPGDVLSDSAISALLESDLDHAAEDVDEIVRNWKQLTQVRRAVLIEMAFNLGRQRLTDFPRMLQAIEDNDPRKAAAEMVNSLWAGPSASGVGPRAWELAASYRLNRWCRCEVMY